MDHPQPTDKVAEARLRAAKIIQAADEHFERADLLTSKCPYAEIVYGIGSGKELCPQCGQDPADHGLVSNFNGGDNPATLLQQEVQKQISQHKGNREEFHPGDKTAITYGCMECIDQLGQLCTYFTCSGNPTKAVTAAMKQLQADDEDLIWVSTIPDDNKLTGYQRTTGKPVLIELKQIDNPPNVCAACKLLQFAMSNRLAPISLTETYGQTGKLKESCLTCTQNIVQMMCGKKAARGAHIKIIELGQAEAIQTLAEKQKHAEAVESWQDCIVIGQLKPMPDAIQFLKVYSFIVKNYGVYDGTSANEAMLELIASKEFLTAFNEDPDAREEVVAARMMFEGEKLTLQERQRLNKAKAKDRKKEKKGKKSSASAASVDDDEPEEQKPNWKQMLRNNAAENKETQ